MKSDCGAGEESKKEIEERMEELKMEKGIASHNSWLMEYYQKANRLLFANFLESNGIDCVILYIYFTNGYKDKGIDKEEAWINLINEQDSYLGIANSEWAKGKVKNIIIDCRK